MLNTVKHNKQWIVGSFATASILVLIAACSPSVKPTNPIGDLQLPAELQDCKFFRLSDGITSLNVARCPNSTTSVTTSGKNPVTTITAASGAVSQEDYDKARAEVDAAYKDIQRKQIELSIAQAEASIAAGKARLEQLK